MIRARFLRYARFPVAEQPITFHPAGAPASECEAVLRTLPEWFGIEESLLGYAANAGALPTWVVRHGGQMVGFLSLRRHFACSVEIDAIAIRRNWRGQGHGHRLVNAACASLARDGARLLQVKSLSSSHPSRNYAETRRFYEKCGFVALEEIQRLRNDHPCLVLVKAIA